MFNLFRAKKQEQCAPEEQLPRLLAMKNQLENRKAAEGEFLTRMQERHRMVMRHADPQEFLKGNADYVLHQEPQLLEYLQDYIESGALQYPKRAYVNWMLALQEDPIANVSEFTQVSDEAA